MHYQVCGSRCCYGGEWFGVRVEGAFFGVRMEGAFFGVRMEGGFFGVRVEGSFFGIRVDGGILCVTVEGAFFGARVDGGFFGVRVEGESFGVRVQGGILWCQSGVGILWCQSAGGILWCQSGGGVILWCQCGWGHSLVYVWMGHSLVSMLEGGILWVTHEANFRFWVNTCSQVFINCLKFHIPLISDSFGIVVKLGAYILFLFYGTLQFIYCKTESDIVDIFDQ